MKFLLSADGDVAVNAEKVDALVIDVDDAQYNIRVYIGSEIYCLAEFETLDEAKKEMADLLKVLSGYASDGIVDLQEAANHD